MPVEFDIKKFREEEAQRRSRPPKVSHLKPIPKPEADKIRRAVLRHALEEGPRLNRALLGITSRAKTVEEPEKK